MFKIFGILLFWGLSPEPGHSFLCLAFGGNGYSLYITNEALRLSLLGSNWLLIVLNFLLPFSRAQFCHPVLLYLWLLFYIFQMPDRFHKLVHLFPLIYRPDSPLVKVQAFGSPVFVETISDSLTTTDGILFSSLAASDPAQKCYLIGCYPWPPGYQLFAI